MKQPSSFENILAGSDISLRAPEPGDVDALYLLENDPDASVASALTAPLSRQQLWDYVANYSADIFADKQLRLVIVDKGGELAGAVDLYDFDPRNRRAFMGIGLRPEFRGTGLGTQAVDIMCRYAAAVLGLHQLAAVVAVDNEASLRLFAKTGFKPCGKLRSWQRRGAQYVDAVIFQKLFADS